MPLDGHSYLVAQGWGGKGTGLRQGAISRPLAVPKKKTLGGLGKDRDDAFPFWDHLFSTAAKSIQVKVSNSDVDDSDELEPTSMQLKRTTTGIFCNRRPVIGASASTSGTSSPQVDQPPRTNLLSITKREVAKQGLYARFFRGPVLSPDTVDDTIGHKVVVVEGLTEAQIMRNTAELDTVADERSKKRKWKWKAEDQDCDEERAHKLQKKLRKENKKAHRRSTEGMTAKDLQKSEISEEPEALDRKEKKRRKRQLKEAEKQARQAAADLDSVQMRPKKSKESQQKRSLSDSDSEEPDPTTTEIAVPPFKTKKRWKPQDNTERTKKRKRL